MLDLARPLGVVEGLVCYRDHEDAQLVYYLPNEVKPLLRDDGTPDVGLQIFFRDVATISEDDIAEDDLAGAILSIGAQCSVAPETLDAARRRIAGDFAIAEPRLTPPPWQEGKVELLIFDRIGTGAGTEEPDSLVRRIVGARRPSLQSPSLDALFHARLDQRGAALAAAALQGQVGSIGGVIYELGFSGLRPSAEVRISANLNRVAQAITAKLGVNAYYVGAEVGTTLQDITEEGIIKVERTTFADDAQTRSAIDEAVKDFQDRIMRELFRPSVPPMPAAGTPSLLPSGSSSIVTVSAHFTRMAHDREIRMDYRERAAARQLHTPQAHLGVLGTAAAADAVQRVPLSTAWTAMEVEVDARFSFTQDPSLRRAEVILWRSDDGVLAREEQRVDGLRLPPDAAPLAELAFAPNDAGPLRASWAAVQGGSPRYLWQARFQHAADELLGPGTSRWTPPEESGAQDLDLMADILVPTLRVDFELAPGLPEDLRDVTLTLHLRDAARGSLLDEGSLTLAPERPSGSWARRLRPDVEAELFAAPRFRFADGRELSLPFAAVRERNPRVSDPFARRLTLTARLIAPPQDLLEAVLDVAYDSPEHADYRHRPTARLNRANDFQTALTLPVLGRDDQVSWEVLGFFTDGSARPLQRGTSTGGTVFVMPTDQRQVKVVWVGPPPSEGHLLWVRVNFRQRLDDGSLGEEDTAEFRGDAPPGELTVSVPLTGRVLFEVERRFLNGQVERTPLQELQEDTLVVGNQV